MTKLQQQEEIVARFRRGPNGNGCESTAEDSRRFEATAGHYALATPGHTRHAGGGHTRRGGGGAAFGRLMGGGALPPEVLELPVGRTHEQVPPPLTAIEEHSDAIGCLGMLACYGRRSSTDPSGESTLEGVIAI